MKWLKLAHCVRTVAAVRRVTQKCYLIWLFPANIEENNTQKVQNKIIRRYKAHICQAANTFLVLVSSIGWRGGDFCFLPLKTSSPVKVEGTPGSCLFASCRWLYWPLCACSEVPHPPAVFSSLRPCYLFTSSTTCSNISPSLSAVFARAAFHSSLSRGTACLWRTSFHCIRNWYLNACEVTVKSVFGCVDWKVLYAQHR